MFYRKRKAQAILEYIIILTALIAGFLFIRSTVQDSVHSMLEHASGQAAGAVNNIRF